MNKINAWLEILFGEHQGSIHGLLLFYILIGDLLTFLPKDGTANYADDNTPYSAGDDINNIIIYLEHESNILSK